VLAGRALDYLVVNHMEPDHCGSIEAIVRQYPKVQVVGNRKTFEFFKRYYDFPIDRNAMVVKEQGELSTGNRILRFHLAPMVHWPEVMFTVDMDDGILFSADAFGSFGAHPGTLFADETDDRQHLIDETRRYFTNIVGRYGDQVLAVLARLPMDRIRMICPLHGPIWRHDVSSIVGLHRAWSSGEAEKEGVVIAYASMYGNTAQAVDALANKLAIRGVTDIRVHDVSRTHASYIIGDIWRTSHLVLASPTYNMQLYPPMDALLRDLAMLNLKHRSVAVIGNHTWSSAAVKQIIGLLGTMKDIRIIGTPLDIHSSLKAEHQESLDSLADEIVSSVLQRI
jgi:flavorubredoxin